ncbi:MAG: methylated-DNA--[protein]-cysteine S-methyltransferase [Dokdonella sp.]|uniref:bifunctional transcriptional activator/DNA repair enzyme AdaA n=1 Tax=Dokdonella sp. TaxID=2291710 RepID=UPI0032659897
MNKPASAAHDPLERARSLIESTRGENAGLSALAAAVGLSPTYLQRRFRERFGLSPAEYARQIKLGSFKSALREGSRVTDAIYDAGFGSGSRVYEQASAHLGMTPGDYRRGGAGTELRFTTVATALGAVLVAATARGICAVSVGRADDELTARLRNEFPNAHMERIDDGRDEWLVAVIERVVAGLSGDTPSHAQLPPLDVRATAFQWRVWQALTRIPAGETRTYAQIAEAIDAPRSARAIANACGANRLAFVVPCHRVVRTDGQPGGWRWGPPLKRRLLAMESRVAPG